MAKLFSFNMMTLDGFFEGPGRDIGWHNVDEEFNDFAIRQLESMGMILFGRATYEGMASFWPTPFALENDPVVAGMMNAIPKAVFSRTLNKAEWNNTRLIKDDIAGEIARIKQSATKDIGIFGSANLIASLMPMNVIDEHRIMINPVVLGAGTPLFNEASKINFALIHSCVFTSGNVLLTYAPAY
jgi:dihydrofolate reductase